ncbi:MAG: DUF1343 domain-containing protein, partial [Desulfurivibrio sp.]|nr:DUF1343 domain-containing protein [Desulfurivibrio sp.]
MIESDGLRRSPSTACPYVSLYGPDSAARPQGMLDDTWMHVSVPTSRYVGCRIYTYISTLKYFLEACRILDRLPVTVLDRPNPGRTADRRALMLESGQESFVGCDELPTRHGLTVGELARWFKVKRSLDVELQVIGMDGYDPHAAPGYGWPT